mmetsp:Transcript_6973/g.6126  ORF Transcript_6973/g.6126 Transcript_6973/m.6126 type:complete len:152 (-) Transcript_6973:221-676(-)
MKSLILLTALAALAKAESPPGNEGWLLSYFPCWAWDGDEDIWLPGIETSYEAGSSVVSYDENPDYNDIVVSYRYIIEIGLDHTDTPYCYNYIAHSLIINVHEDTLADANFSFFDSASYYVGYTPQFLDEYFKCYEYLTESGMLPYEYGTDF